MLNPAVIVLAAGSSSRLGTPKQLLNFKGKPLLLNVVEESLRVSFYVIVITGCQAEKVTALLTEHDVECIQNPCWEDGMSTGIAAGVKKIMEMDERIDSVLITVCDQPHVSAPLFRQMLQVQRESGKSVVACGYDNTIGVPVLFLKQHFELLKNIKGNDGAKKIISSMMDEVAVVDFPLGAIDIDTPEDYRKLINP